MNIEYRSPENHSQVTEQLFTDRIAIIDLPKEMWNEEGAPNVLAATPRQEPELLKSLGEHLEHAVTLVRPAASWVGASFELWQAAYAIRVPSSLYAAWFPEREEQRSLYWALMDRGFGLRSCRSGNFYYVEVDLGRLGAALAQWADPVEEYRRPACVGF